MSSPGPDRAIADATPGRTHRLVRPDDASSRPVLDEDQRRVVDHPGGPLLVLAGPGTGKTTTLVEAIAERIEGRGVRPEEVLALTFSRKAAEQLRDRVTARLGRTVGTSLSSTFHSFAYGLIREFSPSGLYEGPLRLLSAPEQDVVLQDLLTDAPESVPWPPALRRAVGTRGFAREVLDVLARAREKGLDGPALRAFGERHDRPELAAAGLFLDQYLDVLDSQGAVDYADLVRRAVIEAEVHRDELRARYRYVVVDEYQDTDPSQVRLLRALAGDGRDLVVVGDPHQSIYGFRGAEVRGILDFPHAFPRRDGERAEVLALRTTRRFGPRVLVAAQRVASRLSLPGSVPAEVRDAFRNPVAAPLDPGDGARRDGRDDGRVDVRTFDTERAEAEHLADLLRREHLERGTPWSGMAVLVRSGRATIPPLRRALAAAGVPVEVASDDTPLVREPALQPLLAALRLVVHRAAPPQDPDHVDATAVQALLGSPLADLDVTDVRALARRLRRREKDLAAGDGGPPRSSAELVREAVLDPSRLADLDDADSRAVRRATSFARLLERAMAVLDAGGTAGEVLWELWGGTTWPARLRARVEQGGQAARLAHRDLDAVCALFEAAERSEEQRGHRSVAAFLATLVAQQIPADTLAERGIRGAAVRLLTAHRAKGLEWELVVVAHVQEEGWPDLRRRATLLRADRIGTDGPVEPASVREMLVEERRLFYVACTRARRRLVVTAVRSPDDDGEQPSRFLHELRPEDAEEVLHRSGRPPRPLSLAGVVADLRRRAADPGAAPGLRRAAAQRLARLAAERDARGRPVVPAADPGTWWGTRSLTTADAPVRPADRPVVLSASAVAEIEECPARWFLQREAGGSAATSQAQGFGNIVHVLADRVARGEVDAGVADVERLMAEVDRVWARLTFRTPWSGPRERTEVHAALARFLGWHGRAGGRALLATEQDFRTEVTLPDGERVVLRGRADRLELDADGRVVVVDLKTGKYPPPDRSLDENPQLGLYQYAVDHGGFAEVAGPDAASGGAELWQLRRESHGRLKVQSQAPQVPGEDGRTPIERQLAASARAIRTEDFEARPGPQCERCQFARLCPAQQSGTVLE